MKTTFIAYIVLFSCLLLVVGCSKKDDSNPITPPTLGASYGGGIVVYLLQSGDPGYNASVPHGLIAAPNDQGSNLQWGCYGTIVNAPGRMLGTGMANTDSIAKNCGSGSVGYLCDILILGGYSDWYLPSKDELNKLYIFHVNYPSIGDFASVSYWSSSEVGAGGAWYQPITTGVFYNNFKNVYCSVRAIRSF